MNNGFALSWDIVIMLMPLIVLQLGLAIFCIVKIHKEGVRNLNKTAWTLISLLGSLIGPILFLIIGRKKVYG